MRPRRAHALGPWLHALGATLALVLALALFPASSHAQPPPPEHGPLPHDVAASWSDPEQGMPALPEPPEGYRTERRGPVEWVYPLVAASDARDLQATFDGSWQRITDDLGVEIERDMTIRVARNPDEMRAMAPVGHPPPPYASGVAYPAYGVILLTLTAPETWRRPPMKELLAHELSHVALRRAVQGRSLPRWFVEGVAIHQAGEYSLARTKVLWEATLRDTLIPLNQLSGRFPGKAHEVNLAYAQSADVIRFLRDDSLDARRFEELIEYVRDGKSFEDAVMGAYYVSVHQLEREWHAGLRDRFQALPLVLGGGTLWVLAAFLLLVAYLRRKRRTKRTLARWEQQETELEELERSVERRARALDEDEPERVVVFVSGQPPQGREPEVPTIEHEGTSHTLH